MIRTVIQAGFGNQLFQYATGYALSRKLNQELQLDMSFFDYNVNIKSHDVRYNNLCLLRLDACHIINNPKSYWQYRVKSKIPILRYSFVDRKIVPFICEDIPNCRKFQAHLFDNIKETGATIFGFWQNTKYFDDYLLDLKRQFVPNYSLNDDVKVLHNKILNNESIGVHIRRGDFVRLGWNKGADYYMRGIVHMRQMCDNAQFYIVTDDVAWAKEQFKECADVSFVDVHSNTKDVDEFFLLSSCKHQIISESTFGWWAAYLNTNEKKIVMVPQTAKGQIFNQGWIKI